MKTNNAFEGRIVTAILQSPGQTQKRLANILEVTPQKLATALVAMRDREVISLERRGGHLIPVIRAKVRLLAAIDALETAIAGLRRELTPDQVPA